MQFPRSRLQPQTRFKADLLFARKPGIAADNFPAEARLAAVMHLRERIGKAELFP